MDILAVFHQNYIRFHKSRTRLLVSGRSPACSTAFLSLWSSNNIKKTKFNKIKWEFIFLKFEIFFKLLIVPNWPKWQSLNPHNFTKIDHRWFIFSNLSSGRQYFSNDVKKFRQKWLVKKSKFVWRKKNPPRAQIFRYFCIESRNKKSKLYKKILQFSAANLSMTSWTFVSICLWMYAKSKLDKQSSFILDPN